MRDFEIVKLEFGSRFCHANFPTGGKMILPEIMKMTQGSQKDGQNQIFGILEKDRILPTSRARSPKGLSHPYEGEKKLGVV